MQVRGCAKESKCRAYVPSAQHFLSWWCWAPRATQLQALDTEASKNQTLCERRARQFKAPTTSAMRILPLPLKKQRVSEEPMEEMGGFTVICSSEFGGFVRRDFACSGVCRLPTLHSLARISMACVQRLPWSTKGLPVQNRQTTHRTARVLL